MNRQFVISAFLVFTLGACIPVKEPPQDLELLTAPKENRIDVPLETGKATINQEEIVVPRQINFTGEADAQTLAWNGPVVYFFRASWCPTCQALQKELDDNIASLPPKTTIVTVDYDKETALKRKYGITYQHTLVQIDSEGNEITKWQGGGVEEIKENLKI